MLSKRMRQVDHDAVGDGFQQFGALSPDAFVAMSRQGIVFEELLDSAVARSR
jgi:hypothetical protein